MFLSFTNVFNILDGDLPKFGRFIFENVVHRAERLLAGCNLDQYKGQIDALGWLTVNLDPDRFMHTETEEPKDIEPSEQDATMPSLVFNHMHELEDDELQGFTWSQYFGLLALYEVHQAVFLERITTGMGLEEDIARLLPDTLASYAAEAVEADLHR